LLNFIKFDFLKIGAEPTIDPVQLQEISPSMDLLHSVLAVSHADSVEAINERNVAGFIYVYVERKRGEREKVKEKRVKRMGRRKSACSTLCWLGHMLFCWDY
jgi:hypothetical protein